MEQGNSGIFIYSLASGLALGVALAQILPVGLGGLTLGIGTACVLLVLGVAYKNKKILLATTLLAAVAVGVVRTDIFLANHAAETLTEYAGQKVVMVGRVDNDPERRSTSMHVIVDAITINNEPVRGTLLAIVGRDEPIAYNDTVTLNGRLELPQSFTTNTGHVFDYTAYLDAQGVSVVMRYATLSRVTHSGISVQGGLFILKHWFESSVEHLFPEPDASLLEGILLGERRGIPQELTQAFIASSLVHVVVLSGHNITIVSEGVFRALAFLPRTASFGVGGVLMVLFAAMTGFGATTVRALVMALVALLARYLHRSALALRSLAVAGAAMVLWNPLSLLHDTSFILSVLATFGLITLSPWVERNIPYIPNYKKFDARSIVATTIAVELFVTPALLYFSGTLSIFALPANLIALPVIPLAMLSGFLAGLIGFVSPVLALLPTFVCDVLLKWLMLVATTTEALPFSTATVAQFPVWILLVVYVPLTAFAISIYRRDLKN